MPSKFTFDNDGRVINRHTGIAPTAEEIAVGEKAYQAALQADSAFQIALEKKYGSRAGDMRYRTEKLPEYLKKLATAYHVANEAYRATFMEGE